jgi:hypothetical protein
MMDVGVYKLIRLRDERDAHRRGGHPTPMPGMNGR